jgi:SRSO17 transposase
VEKLIAEATVGNGVLIFDDIGFEKKGKASVGVARQYSGTLSKVGNFSSSLHLMNKSPMRV